MTGSTNKLKKTFYYSLLVLFTGSFLSHSMSLASEISDQTLNKIQKEIEDKSFTKSSLAGLMDIVNQYPTNARAHLLLGNCCDSMGLPEQAMEQYKLAFKYNSDDPNSVLQLIKAQIRAGQISAANCLLKEAMQRFPTDPQILLLTGNALLKERRYDEAKDLYVKAIGKNKKPIAGVSSALGNLSLHEGRYKEAFSLACLDLAQDPNSTQANEVAGFSLFRMGRLEQSLPYLAIAYKNEPNNFELAVCYAQALIWCGKYNDALMPLISAFSASPNFSDKEKVVKAIDYISPNLSKHAILDCIEQVNNSRQNKDEFIHLELAHLCINKDLPDAAFSQSIIAEKINPNSAQAKYNLALIAEKYRHDYTSALYYLRAAKAADPYNRQINEYLMRLEDRLTVNKSDWAWQLKDWLVR